MKLFRKRIRRIEEAVHAPVTTPGKKPPILQTVLVECKVDPHTSQIIPTTIEDSQYAVIEEKTYPRADGESLEHFQARVEKFLGPLKARHFAFAITYKVSLEAMEP